jgi:hypothetical protein
LSRAISLLADGVLSLLLGRDEHDRLAARDDLRDEVVRVGEQTHRLAQVHDVDAVARAVDVRTHLRVPTIGLVAEVDARLKQIAHGNLRHSLSSLFVLCLRLHQLA